MKKYLQELRLADHERTFEYLWEIDPVRRADTISHMFYNKVAVQEQYDSITVEELKQRKMTNPLNS